MGRYKSAFALLLHEGTTTSNGNVGKTTLVDSSLIGENDFLSNYNIIEIISGDARLETRAITSFSTITGEITVESAFSAQILSGIGYRVFALKSANTTGAGTIQIATTTIDLNQVVGDYTLFTGTTQDVLVESLVIRMPDIQAAGALTSISIQTNDTTPIVFISSALGAVANLSEQAQLSSAVPIVIATGQNIQLTIAGGAHGVAYVCDVIVIYKAIVARGTLA